MPKVTQLVECGYRTGSRVWLLAFSTPPLNCSWSFPPLFSLPHTASIEEPILGKATIFCMFCLPLRSHSVPSNVLSEHACLKAAPASCCHVWGWGEVDWAAAAAARRLGVGGFWFAYAFPKRHFPVPSLPVPHPSPLAPLLQLRPLGERPFQRG